MNAGMQGKQDKVTADTAALQQALQSHVKQQVQVSAKELIVAFEMRMGVLKADFEGHIQHLS